MDFFLQLAINGILLGGFYSTMTLGFSTIWGVMRLINLAHGEFLLMGAFTAWFFFNPHREQALTISAHSSGTVQVVMLVVTMFASFIFSRIISDKVIPDIWIRRWVGLGAACVLFIPTYLLWANNDFADVSVSVMAIVMVGMALSLGFIISHIFLRQIMGIDNPWQRRFIGYLVGPAIVIIGHDLWQAGGYQPIDPFLTLPLLFPLFFGLGYVLQRAFFNRLVEGPYLTMLLVTFAVAIILQNFGLQIYKADPRKINVDYGEGVNFISTLTVSPTKFITLMISGVMILVLAAFLQRTRTGYAIRAAAQNKMAARLMGINIHEVYGITFGISLGLTAVAGAMMGTFQPVTPVTGAIWTLRAFAIVALGGLGNIRGVVVGGLVLGLVESFVGGYIGIGWGIAAAFIMLVVMLIVRPQGITGGLVSSED